MLVRGHLTGPLISGHSIFRAHVIPCKASASSSARRSCMRLKLIIRTGVGEGRRSPGRLLTSPKLIYHRSSDCPTLETTAVRQDLGLLIQRGK